MRFRVWKKLEDAVQAQHSRKKRGLGAVLAGGLVIITGFTAYEQIMISSHIKSMRKELLNFKNEQVQFNKLQLKFNRKILKIYKVLENQMSDKIRDLECMVATTVTAIVNNRRFIEWKAYIDMVFKDIISGTGEGRISPALITKDNVKMILEENSTLNTSAMRDHPTMIYEFGKMYVAKTNVDTDSFNAHLILKVPILKSEEIYPLYDVHHTGIREGIGA